MIILLSHGYFGYQYAAQTLANELHDTITQLQLHFDKGQTI